MNREQLIEELANIQYFIKTKVYGSILDKGLYTNKIRKTYENISIEKIEENLELIKYAAIGAINLNNIEKIQDEYNSKKHVIYEEYLNKLESIQDELDYKISKLNKIKIDELKYYISGD